MVKRAALVISLVLTGCASSGTVDRNVGVPSGDEAVFVLGVSPEHARVSIVAGKLLNGFFERDQWTPMPRVYANPTNGYVVWKAPASETTALTSMRLVKEKTDFMGVDFDACGERRAIVFRPEPAGKVIYLGDVDFTLDEREATMRLSEDADKARAYLEQNFPLLRGQPNVRRYGEFIPMTRSCAGTSRVVPIDATQRES